MNRCLASWQQGWASGRVARRFCKRGRGASLVSAIWAHLCHSVVAAPTRTVPAYGTCARAQVEIRPPFILLSARVRSQGEVVALEAERGPLFAVELVATTFAVSEESIR